MGIKNELVISTITAFVSVDADGNEGIMGMNMDGQWIPFVCADEARIASIYPHADNLSRSLHIPFRILQFSAREDITEAIKKRFGHEVK